MRAELVTTEDIFSVISKTLGIMSAKVLSHGEIVAYIFYNMLKEEASYSDNELAEWTMIAMLHDIGAIKTDGTNVDLTVLETKNVWAHSIYGYLFLRYLSPVGSKADAVLYHHLAYNLHNQISCPYMKEAEYLTLADKMDVFMRTDIPGMERDYFAKKAGIDFSPSAMDRFNRAQKHFKFLEKLKTEAYREEMREIFRKVTFSEKQKRGFLEMLVYAIDFRSQQTVIHTMSTKAFSLEIGKLMRVNKRDMDVLYYGSLLHDIGKIAIPLSILECPRRLTDEEMRIMKAHVIITDRILNGVLDEKVARVAARHHEKLDGSGYPLGLKEADLSNLEQYVAVADILSALYSKRSYKEAFPPEKVKGILQSDADNGKINKEAVKAVIDNFDMITRNYETERNDTMERYKEILDQYDSIYQKFKVIDVKQYYRDKI